MLTPFFFKMFLNSDSAEDSEPPFPVCVRITTVLLAPMARTVSSPRTDPSAEAASDEARKSFGLQDARKTAESNKLPRKMLFISISLERIDSRISREFCWSRTRTDLLLRPKMDLGHNKL